MPSLTARDDVIVTSKSTPVSSSVFGNDTLPAGQVSSFALATTATNGQVILNTDGTYTYTPNVNFVGTDSFNYTVTDQDGLTSTAKVTVTVGDTLTNPLHCISSLTDFSKIDFNAIYGNVTTGTGAATTYKPQFAL